ncbi:MAG TPA: hypothetical protein VLJ68_05835 [Chitinophagaceae bacterium]|nr:hypothetical protein [Chitinophagaceae bacterium]
MEQQNQPLFQLNLDAQNGYTLRSAASWSKVLGVVSLIMGILLVIMGIIVQSALSSAGGGRLYGMRNEQQTMANVGMVMYIIFGIVFIISAIFSLNFGNKIGAAMKANDQNALNAGFAGARNFFAFWTILLIICLLLVLIGVAGLLSASGSR